MASNRELQLIRLACRRRWLTAEEGEDCLFLKLKLGDKLTIEQILRQRGYLSEAEIAELTSAAGYADRRRRPARLAAPTTASSPVAPTTASSPAVAPTTASSPAVAPTIASTPAASPGPATGPTSGTDPVSGQAVPDDPGAPDRQTVDRHAVDRHAIDRHAVDRHAVDRRPLADQTVYGQSPSLNPEPPMRKAPPHELEAEVFPLEPLPDVSSPWAVDPAVDLLRPAASHWPPTDFDPSRQEPTVVAGIQDVARAAPTGMVSPRSEDDTVIDMPLAEVVKQAAALRRQADGVDTSSATTGETPFSARLGEAPAATSALANATPEHQAALFSHRVGAVTGIHRAVDLPGGAGGSPVLAAPVASAEVARTVAAPAAGTAFDPEVEDAGGPFGPYDIQYLVARGQRSAVYRARHMETSCDVALKILLAPGRAAALFVSERGEDLVAAAKLDHPRVVRVLDVGHVDHRYYVALQYAPGWALDDKLAADEELSLVEALRIGADLAAALAAAERSGVTHADIRPNHIIIEDGGRARLTGFGFYRIYQGRRGTPGYMAPEVAAGQAPSPLGDQFGLGALLFRLVAGRSPFDAVNDAERMRLSQEVQAPDPRLYRADLPAPIAQIILRLLSREPSDRFSSFHQVLLALESERAPLESLVVASIGPPPIAIRPLVARAMLVALGVIAAAVALPLGLERSGLMSLQDGGGAGLVGLASALALGLATVAHAVVALIRRGELPLPLSSAWMVGGQELAGLVGATLLVAGFVIASPAVLNLALAGAGGVLLASGIFGAQLRSAVAAARDDGGRGRVLAVLGDVRLIRWRSWHVPALTTVGAVAAVRSMAQAYFVGS